MPLVRLFVDFMSGKVRVYEFPIRKEEISQAQVRDVISK